MLINNYLKSGWRNLIKHKLFSLINIMGLAIGLASVILITLYVRDELSYDKMWSKADQIHRTNMTFLPPGRDPMHAAATPGIAYNYYVKDFPQIEHATRLSHMGATIKKNNDNIVEDIALVDADMPNVFDIEVISGDLISSLNDNSSIALSQTVAKKYFGEEQAIGKVLTLDFSGLVRDYKVTAVYEDLPRNTTISLPAFVLIDENDWTERPWLFGSWYSVNTMTYFVLNKNTDVDSMIKSFPDFINRNFSKFPMGGDDAITSDFIKMGMMNIKDLHLKDSGMGSGQTGSMTMVLTFSAIAILILIIASINFMNLSTARASQRAREVSMRKVVGASRSQLVTQFLGESVMITLFGLIIAIGLVELLLPPFSSMIGKELIFDYASLDILKVIGLAIFVGFVGGVYPAFVLSNFRPATVLKANKSAETRASAKLRTALVVLQFSVTIGLFIATGVIYGQTLYAKSMDPGFNKQNVLVLNRAGRDGSQEHQFGIIEELKTHNNIFTTVTSADTAPGNTQENNNIARTADMAIGEEILIGERRVNFDFFKMYEIPILAGRAYDRERNDFSPETEELRKDTSLTGKVMLNESAVSQFGWNSAEQALGKYIYVFGGNGPDDPLQLGLEVIGIVPDLNFDSLKQRIRPEMYRIMNNPNPLNVILARFKGNPSDAISIAEKIWNDRITEIPFDSSFVDVEMAAQYQTEEAEAIMLASFSGLAILIASLGLFGLAAFTAERRTKEIGIRKVMGAKIWDIVKLLLWQFSKPIIIANFIAWPIAYYFMNDWLQSFVYRIDGTYILALCVMAGIFALIIAWTTVASNAIRVAKTNPINALRYE